MISNILNATIVILISYLIFLIYCKVSSKSLSRKEQDDANIVIKEDHIDTGSEVKDTESKVIESIQWNCLDEEFLIIRRILEKYNIDCKHVCNKDSKDINEIVEIYLPGHTEYLRRKQHLVINKEFEVIILDHQLFSKLFTSRL